jgi:hypothetical protein
MHITSKGQVTIPISISIGKLLPRYKFAKMNDKKIKWRKNLSYQIQKS